MSTPTAEEREANRPKIWAALSAVMGDVHAVGKDSRNQQQGFNFRGIDAVVNAVGPAFRKHGVVCTPHLLKTSRRQYETLKGTIMVETLVEVEYRFIAPDGSSHSCVVPGESADSGDKSLSKAMSVAYRTALLQALCIPTDEEDPDATVTTRKAPGRAQGAKKTGRQSPGRSAPDGGTPASSSPDSGAGGPARRCEKCQQPIGQLAFRKHDGLYEHIECPKG